MPSGKDMPQTREEFEMARPYSIKITMEPKHERGGDLPDDMGTTTQAYSYLTYGQMRGVQQAVADALFALGSAKASKG